MITKEDIQALLAETETQKTESLAIHHQAIGAIMALNSILQKLDEPEEEEEDGPEEVDPQEGVEEAAPQPTPQLVS